MGKIKPTKTFDKERLAVNLARLKKGGETFEVIIEPDNVLLYKKNKMDAKEVLLYEKVFSDAKKGFEASSELMKTIFGTESPIDVAKVILDTGEIQFTQEYRDQKRQEKLKRILDIIVRNAIDPRTHLPHPRNRIEAAVDEAKVRIDDFKDAEDQVTDVISALKPILPIKFATKEIQIKIPSAYAGKAYSVLERYGKLTKNDWLNDGSLLCVIEIPAGLQNEFFDAINSLTQGNTESKVLSEK